MLLTLPWQLLAVVGESLFSLLYSTYMFNHKDTTKITRRRAIFLVVWDLTFFGLLVWGTQQVNIWFVLVAGYFLAAIATGVKRFIQINATGEPIVGNLLEKADGSMRTPEEVAALRRTGITMIAVFYLSIVLMVALGLS